MTRPKALAPRMTVPCPVGRRRPKAPATMPPGRPSKITVVPMTRNTSACRAGPPSIPALLRLWANREATAAATMPRGASHIRNSRSLRARAVPRVEAATARGRTTKIRAPTVATPRQPRSTMEAMGTLAASSTNSMPIISVVSCSLKLLISSMARPRKLPTTMPAMMTESTPLSGRIVLLAWKITAAIDRVKMLNISSGTPRGMRSSTAST